MPVPPSGRCWWLFLLYALHVGIRSIFYLALIPGLWRTAISPFQTIPVLSWQPILFASAPGRVVCDSPLSITNGMPDHEHRWHLPECRPCRQPCARHPGLWDREREEERGVAGSGGEDYGAFWRAFLAALGPEAAAKRVAALGLWDGIESGLPLWWHLHTLRKVDFEGVDCFWRLGGDAIYGGIRLDSWLENFLDA